MKGVLVILDGLGDLPHKMLHGQTPLEAAEIPNMNFLATRGELGYMFPVKPGHTPSSDEGILSLFRNDLGEVSRGQMEAVGAGIPISRGDLCFRVNFATIDPRTGKIVDRRAGRTLTTKEAEILSRSINEMSFEKEFVFRPTVQHRGVLVFKGNFSDDLKGNDPRNASEKVVFCEPTDVKDPLASEACTFLNEFLRKVGTLLQKHEVNMKRRAKGLLPANVLLIRGPGSHSLKLKQYKRWISPSYMPVEIGFSKMSGMKTMTFKYPKLKKFDSYENLWAGLRKACKFAVKCIKKHASTFSYAYVHIKETDLPGHDNKPLQKKMMLEYVDRTLFKFLRKFAPPNRVKVIVTGDHATPCIKKGHSADPVPVLVYNGSIPRPNPQVFHFSKDEKTPKGKVFCEKEAKKGRLGRIIGKDLLDTAGFL